MVRSVVGGCAVAAIAMALLAGCFDSSDRGGSDDELAIDLPAGCDADQTAVAHHAGGRMVEATATVLPCMHRLGTMTLEPTLGVDSMDRIFFFPANYYVAPFGPAAVPTGGPVQVARSSDQGATWELLTPDLAGVPTHVYSADPYFYLDPVTDRLLAEDLMTQPCGTMSISDDGGDTWTTSASGCLQTDHVTIFSGPAATSSPTDYPTIVYRCAMSGGALYGTSTMVTCQRSLDGGMTWLPPGESAFTFLPGTVPDTGVPVVGYRPCSGGSGHGTVGPDGAVYLPRGHCGQPWLAISHDEALTWTRVQVSDLGNPCFEGDAQGPLCEHDAAAGVDAAGTVYYAWFARDDRMLRLVRSFDGGATWTTPLMVAAPGLNEVSMVQLAAGGPGEIALAYYGTTNGPGAPFDDYSTTDWAGYMAVSYDADREDPLFYSARISEEDDPLIRGICATGSTGCGAAFDFIDIRIGPDGTPWASFVDGCFDPCEQSRTEQRSEAVTGRLWGGPSLWDESDPNGPYP